MGDGAISYAESFRNWYQGGHHCPLLRHLNRDRCWFRDKNKIKAFADPRETAKHSFPWTRIATCGVWIQRNRGQSSPTTHGPIATLRENFHRSKRKLLKSRMGRRFTCQNNYGDDENKVFPESQMQQVIGRIIQIASIPPIISFLETNEKGVWSSIPSSLTNGSDLVSRKGSERHALFGRLPMHGRKKGSVKCHFQGNSHRRRSGHVKNYFTELNIFLCYWTGTLPCRFKFYRLSNTTVPQFLWPSLGTSSGAWPLW
jgi:hypothetical protein